MYEHLPAQNHEEDTTPQPKIEELLSKYYEVHGDHETYSALRHMDIDGHDVSWMHYSGHIEYEDGGMSEWQGNKLYCACDFTENVGWKIMDDGRFTRISGANEQCDGKKVAEHLRHLELRKEYLEGFWESNTLGGLEPYVPEIMLDMIQKDKAGEYLGESGEGAHFWGGHYYLQTIHEVTGVPYDKLWDKVYEMIHNKQIQLEGMVIQEYYEPPEPSWSEYGRYEIDGLTVVATIPAHGKMRQNWRYTVLDEAGNPIVSNMPGGMLMHSPDFGVDVEDAERAEEEINELVELVRRKQAERTPVTDE